MKQTVSLYMFRHAFEQAVRSNFSYKGQQVLFDYLEAYEEDTGEEIELDVVALCCEYSEEDYTVIAENYTVIAENYGIDISEADDEDAAKEIVRDYLQDNTQVCGETDEGFVYALF